MKNLSPHKMRDNIDRNQDVSIIDPFESSMRMSPNRGRNSQISSDLATLFGYINAITDDNIVESGTEKYIYYPDTYDGFYDTVEKARLKGRYLKESFAQKDGYSVEQYEKFCSDKKDYECEHSCCIWNLTTQQCEYSPKICANFYSKSVVNWNTLLQHNIEYLQGKLPGIPDNPHPWKKNIELIKDVLIKINSTGVLTTAYQPGMVIQNDLNIDGVPKISIKKPYLQIVATPDKILNILVNLKNTPVKPVDYALDLYKTNINYRFNDTRSKEYVKLTLGIKNPTSLDTLYTDYLLSNKLFQDILDAL